MRKKLIVGNWKMHGNLQSATELVDGLLAGLNSDSENFSVAICPPAIYLSDISKQLKNSNINLGAQTISAFLEGAYTGDIAVGMLTDYSVKYIILGHSERREYHLESNEAIANAYQHVVKFGMKPILCIGENLQQREAGKTADIIAKQLNYVIDKLSAEVVSQHVIAYEPIWAIGTGNAAKPDQVNYVHKVIRENLGNYGEQATVLYGGSVKPENAVELATLEFVDGFLVGGASLNAKSFIQICEACK